MMELALGILAGGGALGTVAMWFRSESLRLDLNAERDIRAVEYTAHARGMETARTRVGLAEREAFSAQDALASIVDTADWSDKRDMVAIATQALSKAGYTGRLTATLTLLDEANEEVERLKGIAGESDTEVIPAVVVSVDEHADQVIAFVNEVMSR